ncbi:phage tail protein, partial [Escherichia coli]
WDDGRKIDEGRKLLSWQKGTLVGGHDDNDSSLDISYMSNGNNSDYVPASADNSITGIQRTAEDNFTGAWISMRPRNVAFNY